MSNKFLFGVIIAHILAAAMVFKFGFVAFTPIFVVLGTVLMISSIRVRGAQKAPTRTQEARNTAKFYLIKSIIHTAGLGLVVNLALLNGNPSWLHFTLAIGAFCIAILVVCDSFWVRRIRCVVEREAEEAALRAELMSLQGGAKAA